MSLEILKLMNIIEEFRKLDTEMQAQSMLTLCIVSQGDEADSLVTVKEIGEKLGITSASASRNVSVLSKWSRHDREGHNLVEAFENPKRRVEKFVRLTHKGKQVIKTVERCLQ